MRGAWVCKSPGPIATKNRRRAQSPLDRAYGADEVFTITINYSGTTIPGGFGSIEVATHSGGIPIVSALRTGLMANDVTALYGILNGTCN